MRRCRRVGCSLALAAALIGAGCSHSSHSATAGSSTAPSTSPQPKVRFGALALVSNPDSGLSFQLKFKTSAPAITTLHVDGPGGAWSVTAEHIPTARHAVPVVDLRARSTYQAWVTTNGGATTSKRVTIRTKALPSDFPKFSATRRDAARMAPGVTLFTVTQTVAAAAKRPMVGNLIAVDEAGEVVWYHRAPASIGDARMIANGHILYEYNGMGAQEIDILGRVVREWAGRLERGRFRKDKYGRTLPGPKAIPVDVDTMHDEVAMLGNGDILTISHELRTVKGFVQPMCGEPVAGFTGRYRLITDVIVEFRPATGRIVHKYPIADYLHPQTNRADANICGSGAASAYPNVLYAAQGAVRDWTHVNAVVLDAKNNRLLVSIRDLDTVLAIKYAADASGPAGKKLWRLGPRGGDFKLAGGGQWQYHQQALELEADGSLLMFDNGNDRPRTKKPYSRAVRYAINDSGPRSTWTVSQQWEFRPTIDGTPAYASISGDANQLSNGDVLVDTGGVVPPRKGVHALIDEVVSAGPDGGMVVFELRVTGPAPVVYRATRVPSLYGRAPAG